MARRDHHVRIVGMTFRKGQGGYPESFHRLSDAMNVQTVQGILDVSDWDDIDKTPEGPAVVLVREPDNSYDPNAIQVHVPALGRVAWVGYIPRDLAARWAPVLDRDPPPIYEAQVSAVVIHPQHPEKPGLQILVRVHDEDCPISEGCPCSCGEHPVVRDWAAPPASD